MIDYSELIPEENEELPESWLSDTLPVFQIEDEDYCVGDCSPLNFDQRCYMDIQICIEPWAVVACVIIICITIGFIKR